MSDKTFTKRDEDLAICIGFLKMGARMASELRNAHAKNLGTDKTASMLGGLVHLALVSFPDLREANEVIDDLALRCGFRIEEHQITPGGRV